MRRALTVLILILGLAGALNFKATAAEAQGDTIFILERTQGGTDSLGRSFIIVEGDTIHTSFLPDLSPLAVVPLSDYDYRVIARELGVEAAAIKAVVEVETGRTRSGFHSQGNPLINYDLPLFRRAAAKRGTSLAHHSSSEALNPVNIKKYGSQQLAQQARYDAAKQIDSIAAMESTFWGMFQIGGFNWKLCGASSREEFVERMSTSEQEQLRLFAAYLENTGLVKYLRSRNWAAFARIYNGPSYAARGYHTKLAQAYNKFKKEENKAQPPRLSEPETASAL